MYKRDPFGITQATIEEKDKKGMQLAVDAYVHSSPIPLLQQLMRSQYARNYIEALIIDNEELHFLDDTLKKPLYDFFRCYCIEASKMEDIEKRERAISWCNQMKERLKMTPVDGTYDYYRNLQKLHLGPIYHGNKAKLMRRQVDAMMTLDYSVWQLLNFYELNDETFHALIYNPATINAIYYLLHRMEGAFTEEDYQKLFFLLLTKAIAREDGASNYYFRRSDEDSALSLNGAFLRMINTRKNKKNEEKTLVKLRDQIQKNTWY